MLTYCAVVLYTFESKSISQQALTDDLNKSKIEGLFLRVELAKSYIGNYTYIRGITRLRRIIEVVFLLPNDIGMSRHPRLKTIYSIHMVKCLHISM